MIRNRVSPLGGVNSFDFSSGTGRFFIDKRLFMLHEVSLKFRKAHLYM